MVSPKLLLLYTRTWGLIMKDGGPSSEDIGKFSESLPSLKTRLTCVVCKSLLRGDSLYSASNDDGDNKGDIKCDHFVCRECQGGDRDEKSKCKGCDDWSFFAEDDTLILLLKGYRQFCKYFLKSEQCTSVLESRHLDESPFDGNNTLDLLMEGASQYKPDVKVNNHRSSGHQGAVLTRRTSSFAPGAAGRSNHSQNVRDSIPKELIFGERLQEEEPGETCDDEDNESEEHFELDCDDYDDDELIQKDHLPCGDSVQEESGEIKSGGSESGKDDEDQSRETTKLIKVEDESGCEDEMDDDEEFQDEEECDSKEDSNAGSIKVTESSVGRTYVHRVVEIVRESNKNQSQEQHAQQDPLVFDDDDDDDDELMDDENEDEEDEFETSSPIEVEATTKQFTIQRFTDPPPTINTSQISRIQTSQPKPMMQITSGDFKSVTSSSSCKVHPNQGKSFVFTNSPSSSSSSSFPMPTVATPSSSHQHQQQLQQQQQGSSPQRLTHSIVLTRPQVPVGGGATVGGSPSRLSHSPVTVRLPGSPSSSIRLSNLGNMSLTSGGYMVRQIIDGQLKTFTVPAELVNKKIIVRPISSTTASNVSIQNTQDGKKIFQYSSSSPLITSSSGGINVTAATAASMFQQHFAATTASTSTMSNIASTSIVQTARSESQQQIQQPQQQATSFSTANPNNPGFSGSFRTASASDTLFGTSGSVSGSSSSNDSTTPSIIRKLKVQVQSPVQTGQAKVKLSPKLRKGCRCGNAATQPGKLTCCGQRCPCYVEAKSCIDCKCKGCKNPYLPGGKKLLQGINAVVDTKTNTTVPIGVTIANLGSPVGASSTNVMTSSNIPMSASPTPQTMNFVPVSLPSGINAGQVNQIFGRIHPPGALTTHQGATFSQIIPLSNFGVGGYTTIPISIFSPLMSQSQQQHPDATPQALQIHNVQSLASLQQQQQQQQQQQHKIIKTEPTHETS